MKRETKTLLTVIAIPLAVGGVSEFDDQYFKLK